MNFLFNAADKAFEAAILDAERCSLLLARQKRMRVIGILMAVGVMLAPIIFFGSLVIGDPFQSPVWQWLLSRDAMRFRAMEIQLGGAVVIGLFCGSIGLSMGADYKIKLLLAVRAFQHRPPASNQPSIID